MRLVVKFGGAKHGPKKTAKGKARYSHCMRQSSFAFVLCFCLVAGFAPAGVAFEGVLDARLTTGGGGGLGEIMLDDNGSIRADIPIPDPITGSTIKTSLLVRAERPNGMAYVVHNTRMWDRYSLTAPEGKADRYEVQTHKPVTLLEKECAHVTVVDTKSGDEAELWLAQDMGDLGLLDRVLRKAVRYAGSIKIALDAKKITGFPLKVRFKKRSSGKESLFEVININAKELDKSLWKIPAGYNRHALPGSPFADDDKKATSNDPLQNAAKSLGNLFGR